MPGFDKLGTQMLLYMQAELTYLERDLATYAALDAQDPETAGIDGCWEKMNLAFMEGKAPEQRDKIEEIKNKLRTYQETLLRMVEMHKLEAPSNYCRWSLNEWLARRNEIGFLDICEAQPWQPENKDDLVSLGSTNYRLDQWLAKALTPLYHRLLGHRKKPDVESNSNIGPIWEYKSKYYAFIGTTICVTLSFSVPIISILGLYFADNVQQRLALISLFTILFSVVLGTMTSCRRSETFAGTAAFAAVQVVFLQGVNQVQGAGQ